MYKRGKKKGLSTIIITLIIILVSLVAIALIWVAVRNVIQKGSEQVSMGQFTMDASVEIIGINESRNNVSLIVTRKPGKGDFTGIAFLFENMTSKETLEKHFTLYELEAKGFELHLETLGVANLTKLSIYPLYKTSSGEFTMGAKTDEYIFSGIEKFLFRPGGGAICGNNLIEMWEECDGTDWGGVVDCTDIGYDSGPVSCEIPGDMRECRWDTSQCVSPPPQCSDSADNDVNGCSDYPADPGCSSASDTSESGGTCAQPQCSDGTDNDANGCSDYPSDSGCSSTSDNTESGGICSDATPPVLSNRNPTLGYIFPLGTTQTTISLNTNENARCKYSLNSGISYASMTNTFTTTGGTSHSQLITGLTNGNLYNYYVRCNDTAGNVNTEDYTISFSVASSGGTIINALSCSLTDVQNAINLASDGDTVQIPACSDTTWSSILSIDLTSPLRAITIRGSGQGVTNIIGNGFAVLGADGKSWRITGMTLKGGAGISISGQSKNFRVDHITFYHPTGQTSGRVIWAQPTGSYDAYISGVIDHCIFEQPSVIAFHYRDNQLSGGNTAWGRALGLGGTDAVYLEDNVFNFSQCMGSAPITDCEGGAFVLRNNVINNAYVEMHDAIVNNLRGCKKWEIYNNIFNNDLVYDNQCWINVRLRSGTGVVFGNKFIHPPQGYTIQMNLYRTYQLGGNPWDTLCSTSSGKACLTASGTYPQNCVSDANCGGTLNSCVNKDGSSASPNGYPCRDQIGAVGNGVQSITSALLWNNTLDSAFVNPTINSGGSYYTQGAAYCSNLNANMPSTCNGQAVNYVPYIYPHPLTLIP